MKKKILTILAIIITVILLAFALLFIIDTIRMSNNQEVIFSTWGRDYKVSKSGENITENQTTTGKAEDDENSNINFALTMDDNIKDNTTWCGTFQLIWNDLKNDLVKQDIMFINDPNMSVVRNLNKGSFTTEDLSESSYYKVYGHPSLELKQQIEDAIKEKFNETSDILDDFDWEGAGPNDYFLYCMLKKEFEFPIAFTKLNNGTFANKYNDVEYFGLEKNSEEQIRDQVRVLYYESDDKFAVRLNTKQNDELILAREIEGRTFNEIYNNINENAEEYTGETTFTELDSLKIPNISFDEKQEYKELEGKPFFFSDGREYYIEKALQTIKFELDNEGGSIKSEAGMMTKESVAILPEEERTFHFDDEFTIFLKEKDKDKPYFSALITDITEFK